MNRKLGRNQDHRNHTLRNLLTSLVLYEHVDTTEAKAKEVKSALDKVLGRHREKNLNNIRSLKGIFFDDNAVTKIVDELIPRYQQRTSGFTHSYHLQNRLGDNATMMRLELVDSKVFVDKAPAETKSETSTDKSVTTQIKTAKSGKKPTENSSEDNQ